MFVINAIIFLFIALPIPIMVSANFFASSKDFMNAPDPVLTSNTSPSVPKIYNNIHIENLRLIFYS